MRCSGGARGASPSRRGATLRGQAVAVVALLGLGTLLAAFSATLRSEVDLGQLSEHLLAVVQGTMQPASVSLWLRPRQGAPRR